ncbi:cyclodeaminase/cyclohydrolase family protein [Clostridium boliviensis]|uniref:Cyclodeaminase/cyclohydrolase family protein n=1 Tax=Clostridium boliviensis TaxID=318465 RepID=A0ABU4GQM4_9CLOT|nr:cyclodeaminase/cyclohydrolase family protein [Clostridium boliviensis]MDW2799938.1 cyclodeaminase/cyclohydrolase family protein [Clostridium boliviensis]
MIKDLTVSAFLEELSSKKPTPGGGGAAALGGAQGVALGEMVINLTLGKKKYADVEDEMQLLLIKLEDIKKEFLRLADEDARVFAPLAAAYGLPSGTEEEKKHKAEVLETHLLAASLVPKAVMEQALEAIAVMDILARKGSRLAVSDVGVGVTFLRSALLGAKMNVSINTKFMKQREIADKLDQEVDMLAETGTRLCDEIYADVEAGLI